MGISAVSAEVLDAAMQQAGPGSHAEVHSIRPTAICHQDAATLRWRANLESRWEYSQSHGHRESTSTLLAERGAASAAAAAALPDQSWVVDSGDEDSDACRAVD